jgi:hypothetical protein
MNEISQFEVPCHYHEGKMYCSLGWLYVMEPDNQMATLAIMDEVPLKCPACNGVGYILLPAGEQLIEMIWRHLEKRVTDQILTIKPLDEDA